MASQRRPHPGRLGAQGIFDYGEAVGAATVVTLAGNFLIIAAARSFNEALTMADKSGVDVYAVVGETARWRREPNTCLGSDWRPRDSDRQTIASGNQRLLPATERLGAASIESGADSYFALTCHLPGGGKTSNSKRW